MGPTILTLPVGARADLRRGRAATSRTSSTWSRSTRSGAASSTTARRSTSHADVDAMAGRPRRVRPGHGAAGLPRVPRPLRAAARHLRALLLLEVDRLDLRHVRLRARRSSPAMLGDVLPCAWEHRRRRRSAATCPTPRVAQMLDHFTQYVGSSPDLSPAVLCGIAHMQTGEGVWYPRGGTRAVPEALAKLAGELGVEIRTGHAASGRILTDGRRGRAASRPTTASRCRWRPWSPTATPCGPTASCSAGTPAASAFEQRRELRAGLLGRGALPGPRPALRALAPSQLRLLARPARGVRLHLPQGRAGARPDLLRLRPAAHRARRRPARRRGAVRPGPHALSAAAPRLEAMLPGYRRTILDKLKRPAACRTSRSRIVFERGADAAGHPRPLPRARRRDLRPGEPRAVHRRLQAGQPQPGRRAASTWPAAPPIPGRACRWC